MRPISAIEPRNAAIQAKKSMPRNRMVLVGRCATLLAMSMWIFWLTPAITFASSPAGASAGRLKTSLASARAQNRIAALPMMSGMIFA